MVFDDDDEDEDDDDDDGEKEEGAKKSGGEVWRRRRANGKMLAEVLGRHGGVLSALLRLLFVPWETAATTAASAEKCSAVLATIVNEWPPDGSGGSDAVEATGRALLEARRLLGIGIDLVNKPNHNGSGVGGGTGDAEGGAGGEAGGA